MSQASRVEKTKSDLLPTELLELEAIIAELPIEHREQVETAFKKVAASTRRRRKILVLVQDALAQLRLDMKYLMFDLEATRRERDEYRDQLEEQRD